MRAAVAIPHQPAHRLAAQIELGKLFALARAGRLPDSGVIVAQLPDRYVQRAGWYMSSQERNLGT